MRVYHFLNENHAIGNLFFRRLKVSRFAQLNDPFELLGADLLDTKHRAAFNAFKKQLNESKGMICFSSSWSNPLLWGHYANKHSGVVLGFDVPENYLTPVKYTSLRTKIEFNPKNGQITDGPKVVDELIRTKFVDWKYENEYRMFINLDSTTEEGGMIFVDFSTNLMLREVILGLNCPLPIDRIRQLLEVNAIPAKVFKAGMALRTFKMVEDRQFRVKTTV
ncbi:DUF2971 domain-containing protein [Polynucleobacter sp. Fuers-14]|jgi:hypothetical protein|uniref:DUF2971 domain-containing protein n=1 Tax=Polynucleobacter sp. Fuers-14 TaxID=1758364 RepID=UPI001C0D6C90|nr:DUF2971 domain-containing protein [Polynucleobacter sp. Fuers-14]MBU3641331.1 DUF2971 domain-containing protein [Polynucleobacter sp. Fuers-14]